MTKKFILRLATVLVITLALVFALISLFKSINYGLDLKGGFEVLYKISSLDGKKVTSDMVTSTYKTIQKRIDVLGVSEPDITIEGKDHIRVKLAGIKNATEARNILSKTASLTFRDTNDNLLMTSSVLKAGYAKLSTDQQGKPAVGLTIQDKTKFYNVTNKVKDLQEPYIVIWLDFDPATDSFANSKDQCGSLSSSKCLSAAKVSQAFASDVIIEGNFTKVEASNLVDLINSGSIPTKMTEISSKTVGAAFGVDSLNKTLIAGIIGIALIITFMSLIYRFAGFISGVGIVIYSFIVFAVFWLIGGVLTLPGIASLVLGVGMAVDACVLSFERIKEELWQGKNMKAAFEAGYKHSFTSIFDANITTLIVAVVLFMFGESSVKGFATMLIISILVTLFVMVFVIKYILRLFVKTGFFDNRSKAFVNVKASDIPDMKKNEAPKKDNRFHRLDFLKYRKWILFGSLALNTICIVFTCFMGLNLSVDYKGGTEITINSKNAITENAVKSDLNTLGYKYNALDKVKDNTIYIKIDNVLSKEQISKTNTYFKDKYNASTEIGVVSNVVKKELTANAIYAVIWAIIGIIIYVSIRFTFNYAISAIIALLHDALLVFSLFSIFRLEISTIFIAAILTIIGYSINDTVVIFDRIRENIKKSFNNRIPDRQSLWDIINISLRTTMTRSVNTVFTVLIAVICLMVFGTHDILNFNIAMLIGLISGGYSSVCIASPLWYELEKKNLGNKKTKKKNKEPKKELDELEIKGINA